MQSVLSTWQHPVSYFPIAVGLLSGRCNQRTGSPRTPKHSAPHEEYGQGWHCLRRHKVTLSRGSAARSLPGGSSWFYIRSNEKNAKRTRHIGDIAHGGHVSAPGWRPTAKESPAEAEVEQGAVGGPVADTELVSLMELLELDLSALKSSSRRKQALMRSGGVSDEASMRKSGKQGRSLAPWVMMEELQMPAKDVRRVVEAHPPLLMTDAETARKAVAWFRNRVGLSSRQLVKVVQKAPGVLRHGVHEVLEPHAQWLEDIGLKNEALAKVLCRSPQILSMSVEDTLKLKTAWLQEALGASDRHIASTIRSFPAFLALSLENLESKLEWMQRRLGMNAGEISKMIRANPSLLGSRVDLSLERKLVWLTERLHLAPADVALVVKSCPSILGYSVDDNLEPTLLWLQERLDLDLKAAAKLIKRFPNVLGLSPEVNLERKLTWLKENLRLSDEQVVTMATNYPNIFGCSAEKNLGPTLEYFCGELNGAFEEVRSEIIARPILLRYSIGNRMIPRVEAMREAGLGNPVFRDHHRAIITFSDVKFQDWLDNEVVVRGLAAEMGGSQEEANECLGSA